VTRKALALVTDSERFMSPPPSDTILASALAASGWIVRRVDWRQKQRWSSYRAVLPRSTWDYKKHPKDFLAWLDEVGAQTRMINSPRTIRWNIDKRYLEDLRVKGISCLQSIYGAPSRLAQLFEESRSRAWREIVIKPVISAGGDEMTRLRLDEAPTDSLSALQKRYEHAEALVLQPFYETVQSFGELSLILFAGEPSHALHKTAAAGEYRVQEDYKGQTALIEARPEVWDQAKAVVLAAGLELSELELIEPSLYLEHKPEAGLNLASLLTERLAEHGEDLHCATCRPA
jgi:glutathione synthase/RimK-type ligase-like ATP-grasp enzyme